MACHQSVPFEKLALWLIGLNIIYSKSIEIGDIILCSISYLVLGSHWLTSRMNKQQSTTNFDNKAALDLDSMSTDYISESN
jgi:hypothetical protein